MKNNSTRHYTDEQLQEKLRMMEKAVTSFYWICFQIDCHGFIELTGLWESILKSASKR